MNKKRYAIVRVEQQCPFSFEKNDKRAFLNRCLKSNYQCNDCYGDTKEQLEKKVAQALELCMKKGYRTITSEEFAKFIVEFLGVVE